MSIEEAVIEKLRSLPADKQREVLRFTESLSASNPGKKPRQSLEGLWIGLGQTPITEEDIAEARKEMWGNFPRDDI